MRKQRIVGICGYARSGKDTAARGLVDQGWRRVAFADPLKQDVLSMLVEASKHGGLPRHQWPQWSWFQDPEKKELIRPLLVEYGRAMRMVDNDYWIKRATKTYVRGCGCFVITDVRYVNEASWIRSRGGCVLQVVRPGVGPANDEEKNSLALVKADSVIPNTGTADELWDAVDAFVNRFFEGQENV